MQVEYRLEPLLTLSCFFIMVLPLSPGAGIGRQA